MGLLDRLTDPTYGMSELQKDLYWEREERRWAEEDRREREEKEYEQRQRDESLNDPDVLEERSIRYYAWQKSYEDEQTEKKIIYNEWVDELENFRQHPEEAAKEHIERLKLFALPGEPPLTEKDAAREVQFRIKTLKRCIRTNASGVAAIKDEKTVKQHRIKHFLLVLFFWPLGIEELTRPTGHWWLYMLGLYFPVWVMVADTLFFHHFGGVMPWGTFFLLAIVSLATLVTAFRNAVRYHVFEDRHKTWAWQKSAK